MNNCPHCQYLSPRSRMVTFLLSLLIFCGFGGVHRIYAGKVITGAIQFLTAGGFFVWQFIDILRIILGCFEDKEGKII
ncbi:MAG: TM2 domain-containing protein [Akkermansia sp.]|nr:TM2 domain-containing protein [Akkermansia sp.]